MLKAARPFPVLRWIALLWMIVWLPAYVHVWGWSNLLHLCDATVILACAGLWWGSGRILSSQAVSALLPGLFWLLNVCWRTSTGHFLMRGTEYMWDAQYPLWVRLLSFFHVVLPGVLLWAVWKQGYDRSGLALQTGIAAVLLGVSRFLSADLNMNYAYRDPVFNRSWGPSVVHLGVILLGAVVLLYLPTHVVLARLFSRQQTGPAPSVNAC